jgi:hypothetical protein
MLAAILAILAVAAEPVSRHDVVWTSPSRDEHGTMPIGNGDIAANVWVEPDGTLSLYLAKSDSWDDNARLLKLGRLRVRLDPDPLAKDATFVQRLDLANGVIDLTMGSPESPTKVVVYVDAHRPVCVVDVLSTLPVHVEVQLDPWRLEPRTVKEVTWSDVYCVDWGKPPKEPTVTSPDTFLPATRSGEVGEIAWYHRNERTPIPATFALQSISPLLASFDDPILHRAFGGRVVAGGFAPSDAWTLRSTEARTRHVIETWALTKPSTDADAFVAALRALRDDAAPTSDATFAEHRRWWSDFWNRSWIRLSTNGAAASHPLPNNANPVAIGSDGNGANAFKGSIERIVVLDRTLTDAEMAAAASDPRATPDGTVLQWRDGDPRRLDDSPALDCTQGLSVLAWITPETQDAGGGRIIDKCAVGSADGWVLDTYPGNSLRFIAGDPAATFDARLQPGRRTFVAGTYDAATGRRRLYVDGAPVAATATLPSPTEAIERGYVLQRYITACAGRGAMPIKFNGSLFTVGRAGHDDGDHDYRRWGPGYWFQNTRLIYWPLFASGDIDLTDAFFRMYVDALPLMRRVYRERYGARLAPDAAAFHETIYFWGLPDNASFGWERDGVADGEVRNPYIRHYRSGSIELLVMALERYDYTRDAAFFESTVIPLAKSVLGFYATFFPRNTEGRLVIEPAASLETWHDASDPLPEIAGLGDAIERLLRADSTLLASHDDLVLRAKDLRAALPPIPIGSTDAGSTLRPARRFAALANVENPELYAVFPYRLFGVGTDGLDIGRRTFDARTNRANRGWCQDSIHAAYLGLADEAAAMLASRASATDSRSRFPAFWGPNYDWVPDQDHGSNILTTLQAMLVQPVGDTIYVLPAWPRGWDCDFKVHAPKNTVLEGSIRDGRVATMRVTPPERLDDIVIVNELE